MWLNYTYGSGYAQYLALAYCIYCGTQIIFQFFFLLHNNSAFANVTGSKILLLDVQQPLLNDISINLEVFSIKLLLYEEIMSFHLEANFDGFSPEFDPFVGAQCSSRRSIQMASTTLLFERQEVGKRPDRKQL